MIYPTDPSLVVQSDFSWRQVPKAAIAGRSGISINFTSGSIFELGWGFYGKFGSNNTISADSEDARNDLKKNNNMDY